MARSNPRRVTAFLSSRRWSEEQIRTSFGNSETAAVIAGSTTQECLPGGRLRWYLNGATPGNRWAVSLERVENSGGHRHTGRDKQVGMVTPSSGVIGRRGADSFEFHAPDACGLMVIHTVWNGRSRVADVFNKVRVPGLVRLPARRSIVEIGIQAEHPDSHYGHPALVDGLSELADAFYARFRIPLQVNDISLIWGGLLDIGEERGNRRAWWEAPHDEHRDGKQADIRTKDLTEEQKQFVRTSAARKFRILEESAPPHFHMRLIARRRTIATWGAAHRDFAKYL